MRKLLLFVLMGLFVGTLSAQDESAKLKNAGNDALRAKNYKEAFTKFEQYLKLVSFKDDATVYNTAFSALKIKNYDAAIKYFDMSIKNSYKLASAYLGKADAEENLKKFPEMIKTLETGIKATPGQNSKLEKMYAIYFLKEGQKFQKTNNIEKAAENYMMITKMTNKGFKAQGLLSLGTLYFNNGAAILQKATPLATTEKDKYEAEKVKALASLKKAQDYLTEAITVDNTNADVKETLKQVKDAIAPLMAK